MHKEGKQWQTKLKNLGYRKWKPAARQILWKHPKPKTIQNRMLALNHINRHKNKHLAKHQKPLLCRNFLNANNKNKHRYRKVKQLQKHLLATYIKTKTNTK